MNQVANIVSEAALSEPSCVLNLMPPASQARPAALSLNPLPTVSELAARYSLSPAVVEQIDNHRRQIKDILAGVDSRLLVVIGPCSIHDVNSAIDYGQRLAALQKQVENELRLVMRAYVEKPRTTVGWKGLVYDPQLDGSNDMAAGLEQTRRMMLELVRLGLPLATEALSPVVTDYVQDLIGWAAIGARTTESQLHREMASGLDCAVGFKNGTDGGVTVALQAMQSAQAAHNYPTVSLCGRPHLRQTPGNPSTHLVLRGGKRPNYEAEYVRSYAAELRANQLPARLMVDCSHGNSNKDYRKQSKVLDDLIGQMRKGSGDIMGVMIESNIHSGQQKYVPGKPLRYGVSLTDGCIGWEETEVLMQKLAAETANRS